MNPLNARREIKTLVQLQSVAREIEDEQETVKNLHLYQYLVNGVYLIFSGVSGHEFAKGRINLCELLGCSLCGLGVYGLVRIKLSTKETRVKIHNLQAAAGKYLLTNAYPVHPDLPAALGMDIDSAIIAALEVERDDDEKRTEWTLQTAKTVVVETLQHCTTAITAIFS